MEAIFSAITVPGWAAGLGAFVIIVLLLMLFRSRSSVDASSTFAVLTQFSLVVVVGGAAYFGLRYVEEGSVRAERRVLDERAMLLAARTWQPGSVLACLDGASEPALNEACERALFAEPQRVAAAVAQVRARLQLLADAVAYSARDSGYLERVKELRDDIERDAYGFVAHVFATEYKCTAESCANFRLLRDPAKVKANLSAKRLETLVAKHAPSWREAEKPAPAPKPLAETPNPTAPAVVAAPAPAPAPVSTPVAAPPPAELDADKMTTATTPQPEATPAPTVAPAVATPAPPRPGPRTATQKQKEKDKAAPRAATAPTTAQRRIPEPVPGLPRVVPRRYQEVEEDDTPAQSHAPGTPAPPTSALPAPTPLTPSPPRQN